MQAKYANYPSAKLYENKGDVRSRAQLLWGDWAGVETETADGFLGLDLPPPPFEDYDLDQIEAFPIFWSFNLGMQYLLNIKGKNV